MTRNILCARLICATIALTAVCTIASAQSDDYKIEGYKYARTATESDFHSDAVFTEDYMSTILMPQNYPSMSSYPALDEAAAEIRRIVTDPQLKLIGVVICGCTSPDGLFGDNEKLGAARVKSATNWFKASSGLSERYIRSVNRIEDWDHLCELIEKSDLNFKEEIIWIIRNKTWGERKRALMDLDGGKIWRRLINEFFPKMRGIRFTVLVEKQYVPIVEEKVDTVYVRDTVYISKTEQNVAPDFSSEFSAPGPDWKESYGGKDSKKKASATKKSVSEKPAKTPHYYDTPWMLAFKTNVLTDVAFLWNVGFEFQIAKHLTINLSGTYTENTLLSTINSKYSDPHTKIYGFSPELRYWFGQPLAKGSYLGVHANIDWYTLKGSPTVLYQNVSNEKPAWCVGLDYGYSLSMDRKNHWGVEFNIGLGYGMYSHYTAEQNGPDTPEGPDEQWYYTGKETKHYVGLTRLGITFSYRFSARKVRPASAD